MRALPPNPPVADNEVLLGEPAPPEPPLALTNDVTLLYTPEKFPGLPATPAVVVLIPLDPALPIYIVNISPGVTLKLFK